MITIIESILGSKFGRIVAEILLVLVLFFGYRAHVQHEAAAAELAKLQASSTELIKSANDNIATETAQHAADNKANEGKTNAALTANTLTQRALVERVRDFDAYRSAHPDVPRPAPGSGGSSGGECGATSCGDLASKMATAGNELADNVGVLSAELQSCQRDRDSLTGLPRDTK